MWKLLPWTGRGASGYPQRECFFCCTTSIILPPYKPQNASEDHQDPNGSPHPSPIVATSSSTSSISTGTPTNWFCSSCHCQNVANPDGTPVEQYTRPMWDEAWNRDRSQLMRHTRPHASQSSKVSPGHPRIIPHTGSTGKNFFRFCHTCQTNQVLTLNMLADYLPGEDDPEYQEKLRLLPEYEASLAFRYPPVCSDCAPNVQQRITERDQFARSWSLGKWLDLKKKASNADLGDCNDRSSSIANNNVLQTSNGSVMPNDPRPRLWCRIRRSYKNFVSPEPGSRSSMAIFAFITIGAWVLYLWTALWPDTIITVAHQAVEHHKNKPVSLFTALAAYLGLFLLPELFQTCCKMEPLQRRIDRARARQLRVEAQGVGLWHATQYIIFASRLWVLLVLLFSSQSPRSYDFVLEWIEARTGKGRVEMLQLAAVSLLVGEASLTVVAASRLGIRTPTALQLVSRPITADGRASRLPGRNDDALLTSLSLDDQAARPPLTSDSVPHGHDDLASSEQDIAILRIDRDADGDAVMEDAATYAARRGSRAWDEESDQDNAHVPAPNAPSWSVQWSRAANSRKSGSAVVRSGAAGPSAYNDFQLGPQRFWEPQNPTGLEDVFGRAVSLDDGPQQGDSERNPGGSGKWSQWFGFS